MCSYSPLKRNNSRWRNSSNSTLQLQADKFPKDKMCSYSRSVESSCRQRNSSNLRLHLRADKDQLRSASNYWSPTTNKIQPHTPRTRKTTKNRCLKRQCLQCKGCSSLIRCWTDMRPSNN